MFQEAEEFFRERNMESASVCYAESVVLNPNNKDALMGCATACWEMKDYVNALYFCKKLLQKETSTECLDLMVKCLIILGDQYMLGPFWLGRLFTENPEQREITDGDETEAGDQPVVLDSCQSSAEESALCADFDAALNLDSDSIKEVEVICIDDDSEQTSGVESDDSEGDEDSSTSITSQDVQVIHPPSHTRYRLPMENSECNSASACKSKYAGARSSPKERHMAEDSPVPSKIRRMDKSHGPPLHHYDYDRRMHQSFEQHRGNVQKFIEPGMKRRYEDRPHSSSLQFMSGDPHHHRPVEYRLIPPGEHHSRPRSRSESRRYRMLYSCPHCLPVLPGYPPATTYHSGYERKEHRIRFDPLFDPDIPKYFHQRPSSPPHMLNESHYRLPTARKRSRSPSRHRYKECSSSKRPSLSTYSRCTECHRSYKTKKSSERYSDKVPKRDRYPRHRSVSPQFELDDRHVGRVEYSFKTTGEHQRRSRSRSIEMVMRFRLPKQSPFMK